jgi:hypothetical protein
MPGRRDAHHIAHDAKRECLAPIRDEAEFHPGAAEKMRGVFFRTSRPMLRRLFSRRGRYSARRPDCLADDPVRGEPVSEARFPANREKNREFRENRRNFEFLVVESDTISIGWNSNSLRNRTGN